jgi:uncharacterized protein YdeI (YjbR/CyaY-like superfamily)
MKRDPRIDAYIANAAPFAKPILGELRARLHAAVPGVTETIKWSMPFFEYAGKPFANMAAFKGHCSFGFWHPLMRTHGSDEAMGQFGRMASMADLPTKAEFARLAKRARALADEGVKVPPKAKAARAPTAVPEDLRAALAKNREALATFEGFSPSAQKDYVAWVTEAKRPETRTARIAQAVEWLAQGKKRHWKYEAAGR